MKGIKEKMRNKVTNIVQYERDTTQSKAAEHQQTTETAVIHKQRQHKTVMNLSISS